MPRDAIKSCCRSTPACRRCPLRLGVMARDDDERDGRALLVEEILLGSARPLPGPVTDALLSLALARSQRSWPEAS